MLIVACSARWVRRVPLATRSFGVSLMRASVAGTVMSGSALRIGLMSDA